ncbi:MAG: NAD(P)-binding domain-containing protein, partial [Nitrospinota bacterium]
MDIGFIGLGNMGGGMAANLLKAGFRLTVNDLRRETADQLLENGAEWADTPSQLASHCEVILTSLPGPREIEAVALEKDGILEGIMPSGVYIDLSTGYPTLARKIFAAFAEKNA